FLLSGDGQGNGLFDSDTGNVPVLVLRIVQLEAEEEKIAVEFLELLTNKFKGVEVETFIGKFKA
ncbi:hypothetical protein ACONX0_004982, partial [Yersinia enterocolitica]